MRFCGFVFLLLAAMAWAQTATPAPTTPPAATPSAPDHQAAAPAAHQAPPPEAEDDDDEEKPAVSAEANSVPRNAPVLTIKGVCDEPAAPKASPASAKPAPAKPPAPKAGCKTVVTREQFEKLASALQPNMNSQMKHQLANLYPKALAMSQEAKKRGLDKDPAFQEKMKFVRMQVLSQELSRVIQQESTKVSDKDISAYYDSNKPAFEQGNLQRIFVPRQKQVEQAKDAKPEDVQAQQQASVETMTKLAADLRERASKGEEFEKLQKEAFEIAGLKNSPPSVAMSKIRRTGIPPSQSSVFDLKPGEVSQVINDPSGHYIYKMDSKQLQPLAQVKEEIHSILQNQHMRDTMQNIQNSATAELNDKYFGEAPPTSGMPGMRPPAPPGASPVRPPAPSAGAPTPPPGKDAPKSEAPQPK